MKMLIRVLVLTGLLFSQAVSAQQLINLTCESPPIKWEVRIDPTLRLIFVTPIDGMGLPPSIYAIRGYGDRYIKGAFVWVDKDGKEKIEEKLLVVIDRYDQSLFWGDANSATGMNEFKCQVKNKKF